MRRVCSDENTGSAGISAMIVFVALVLVAAVVSIVMIKFGQVIFNDTGQDASDTESIMYGKIIIINGPKHARSMGIGMVFQHFSLFDALSVEENIAIGIKNT